MPSSLPRPRRAARLLAVALLALTAILLVEPPSLRSFFPYYAMRFELGLPDFVDMAGDSAYLPGRERLFIIFSKSQPEDGSALGAFDLAQGKYLGAWHGRRLARLSLNPDGSRLYAYDSDEQIMVQFNPLTLAVERQFPLDCPPDTDYCPANSFVAGPGNRLYWAHWLTSALLVSDGDTGELLATVPLEEGDRISALAAHGNALFLAEHTDNNFNARFRRYDISQPVPVQQRETPLSVLVGDLRVAPDGSFLLSGAFRFDAATLALDHTYEAESPWGFDAFGISPDSSSVVLRQWDSGEHEWRLDAYDVATGAIIRSATFPQYWSSYGAELYVLRHDGVAVILDHQLFGLDAHDHIVGLPVALSGFCGSPLRDDFSDPSSGWPIADRGRVIYRYDRDQYSIFQREEGNWSAVSRGDLLTTGRKIEIRTWLPAHEGISGLVFGLNGDWTQFFTFEVLPHLRAWAVLRYDNGWHVWDIQQGAYVNPVGQSNVLAIEAVTPEQAQFRVNGTVVMTLPAIPDGYVGLSGGSLEPVEDVPYVPVDIRFDDYLFANRACPIDGRTQPAPTAHFTRPSFDTLLSDE